MKTIINTTRRVAILLALLALAFSGKLQAQEKKAEDTPKKPIPMIVKGHKWTELQQHFTHLEEEGKKRQYYVSYTLSHEITEEVVEIKREKYYRCSRSAGYFREADNKVYALDKSKKKEWVAFDYNLKIGDTFAPIDGNCLYGDKPREKFRLDQIETLPIAGKERRVFYFSFVGPNRDEDSRTLRYDDDGRGWHPAYIELAYPTIGNAAKQGYHFVWIEGIGVLKTGFVFHRPIGITGTMPNQLLCFTDSDGVEHDIAGIGCDIDRKTHVSAERPDGNLAAAITLLEGKLKVAASDGLQHTVALFTLDGTPLLRETSFTGTFEAQLPQHESKQPLLLLFDGKASIRLH